MEDNSINFPIKKQILFVLIIIFTILLIAEIALSIIARDAVMVKSADENMVFSLYPDKQAVALGLEYKASIQTDSFGFRTCSKINNATGKQGSKKLLILGDSFSEGWGVLCKQTFAGILESKYSGNKKLQIMNGGVHGASSSYFVLRARYFLPVINPDFLLVQFFDNDLDDLDKIEKYINFDVDGKVRSANPPGLAFIPPGPISRKIRELALYRFSRRFWKIINGQPAPVKYFKTSRLPANDVLTHAQAIEKFGPLQSIENLDKAYNGQFSFYRYESQNQMLPNSLWKRRFEKMKLYIQQLLDESHLSNKDLEIIFLYIPAKEVFARGGIDKSYNKDKRKSLNELRKSNPFYKLLNLIAGQNRIILIDGQKELYDKPENYYFPGDAHLNHAGHAKVADAIFNIIDKRL